MKAGEVPSSPRSDKPKLFRGLQIRCGRGPDVLKLLDDYGNTAGEASILKWSTDSVEEFLSGKLERVEMLLIFLHRYQVKRSST